MGLFDAFTGSSEIKGNNKALKFEKNAINKASTTARDYTGQANTALNTGATQGLGYLDTGLAGANNYYDMASKLYGALNNQDQAAWNTYQGSLGLGTPEDRAAAVSAFQHSPGYQAALDEAQQGVLRNYAATGGTASGNVLRQLQTVAQNAQNQDYGNWQAQLAANFNPHQDVSALSNIYGSQAGLMANTGQAKAGVAQNLGSNLSSNLVNLGNTLSGNNLALGQAQGNNAIANGQVATAANGNLWNAVLGLGGLASKFV